MPIWKETNKHSIEKKRKQTKKPLGLGSSVSRNAAGMERDGKNTDQMLWVLDEPRSGLQPAEEPAFSVLSRLTKGLS